MNSNDTQPKNPKKLTLDRTTVKVLRVRTAIKTGNTHQDCQFTAAGPGTKVCPSGKCTLA
jgi:hypothetical protein